MKTLSHRALLILGTAVTMSTSSTPLTGALAVNDVVTLVDNGHPDQKLDLVFVGDGYTDTERLKFNNDVLAARTSLFNTYPFNVFASAFNVHQVNLDSAVSGISSAGQARDTALEIYHYSGTSTGNPGTFIYDPDLLFAAVGLAPGQDYAIVLLNNLPGGTISSASEMPNDHLGIVIAFNGDESMSYIPHEMGHAVGNLEDEYASSGTTPLTRDPEYPNVSLQSNPQQVKWNDLVSYSTNDDPTLPAGASPPPGTPWINGLIGTFEGGADFTNGIFRPELNCRMRDHSKPFCSVCRRELIRVMAPYRSPYEVVLGTLWLKSQPVFLPPWRGRFYMKYDISTANTNLSGRVPLSGTYIVYSQRPFITINQVIGSIPSPCLEPASLTVRGRQVAAGGADLTLADDATVELKGLGDFVIDQPGYMLNGSVRPRGLVVLLDTLTIKDVFDPATPGFVHVTYTITNGIDLVTGRWPSGGWVRMGDGDLIELGIIGASVGLPPFPESLSLTITVFATETPVIIGLGPPPPPVSLGAKTVTIPRYELITSNSTTRVLDTTSYRLAYSIPQAIPVQSN